MSTTACPCALRCLAWRLADVFYACGRPRVQEMVSEDSWHLFFVRRASTPWSNFGRRGWSMSAMRERGGLRMPGMSAGDLCGGPCRFVHAVCVQASASSRKCHCGFSWRFVSFCEFVMSVVPACRVESMSIHYSLSGGGSIGTLLGVVPAAWGGPQRAWRAPSGTDAPINCNCEWKSSKFHTSVSQQLE